MTYELETAPEIRDAVAARAARGVFCSAKLSEEWYQAYLGWWRTRHGFSMEKDWLLFTTSTIAAISCMVRRFTAPAEQVLLMAPAVPAYFDAITGNGRQVTESPLQNHGGAYKINFDDLERKLADPQTTLMLLNNPHSPTGSIWDRAALERIGLLTAKHQVMVIADESLCDLTDPDKPYVPFASVSAECRENSITCVGPAEAFHLAGLQTAAAVIPNAVMRHKAGRALQGNGVAEPSVFAADAAIAAFTKGAAWLDARREHIRTNKDFAAAYFEKELPSVKLVPSEAADRLWLDCGPLLGRAEEAVSFIQEKTGLSLSAGGRYGRNSEAFLCMNAACFRDALRADLDRLRDGLAAYEAFVLARC